MSKRLSTEEFIQKAILKHGNKYNYSKSEYTAAQTLITIICNIHKEFTQTPNAHLAGKGCQKCKGGIKLNTEEFILRAKNVHKDKYDYSKVFYKNSKTKINIICKEHGSFKQMPYAHIDGAGCSKCYFKRNTLTTKDFITKAKEVHGDKYLYDLTIYVHDRKKVKITCPKHGVFEQRSDTHKSGMGCPSCNKSKGEIAIARFLTEQGYKFITGKTFDDCKLKGKLRFDFYIPDKNMCIEYDGEQHFKPIAYYGGKDKLIISKKRDKIKDEYCKKNNIHLLRISYKENALNKLKSYF